ncbi:MAG: ribonuclease III [Nitrospirota bacterium]
MFDEIIDSLQEKLSYRFKNKALIIEAITHKSYLNEAKNKTDKDNERLEFLGDAVLDLVISEYLTITYTDQREGVLSKMKSMLVNETTLADVARSIELGRYILLGKGEKMSSGGEKKSILSDTLEAVIASIYIDGGLEDAKRFIMEKFENEITDIFKKESAIDYKTELQELCQLRFNTLPLYRISKESGPDHQKRFEITLYINKNIYGVGTGSNKKEAEQNAASIALKELTRKES